MVLEELLGLGEHSLFFRLRQKAHSCFLNYVAAASLALACSKADTFSVSAEDAQVPPDAQVQQCFDQDHDGFYAGVNSGVSCGTPLDCNDNDSTIFPGGLEVCDRKDNNCNTEIDEGVQVNLYEDKDKDGFGNPEKTKLGCYIPGMDPDIDEERYVPNNDDCDDTDFMVNPAMLEICDGIDNNCKDGIDEGLLSTYCVDADGDGKGDAADSQEACGPFLNYVGDCSDCDDTIAGVWQMVNVNFDADFDGYGALPVSLCIGAFVPPGYSLNNLDCDDTIMAIHPGALEICDLYDNDCDPLTANGSGEIPPLNTLQQGVCVNSLRTCLSGSWTDNYSGVVGYETIEMSCDGFNNDCDDETDEGLVQTTLYFDGDNDGFGDTNDSISGCAPSGENYVALNGDCDDGDDLIHPNALEICDGVNNDCDENTPDGSGEQALYNTLQAGVCADSLRSCINGNWLNDYSPVPNYEALETLCDGLDNDCDEGVDENLIAPTQPCSIGTGQCLGWGLEYKICQGQAGWSQQYFNCDAVEGEPGEEIEDGMDNDCDGLIDDLEGLCEMIDDFNRPNQNGLGNNTLGNPWIEYGTLDDWDIEENAAVTSYTGSFGTNPRASSEIGYKSTFNILLRFKLSEVNAVGNGGAFIFNVNSSIDIPNGLAARIAVANSATHYLTNGEEGDVATGNQSLQPNTFYLMRFAYDGSTLRLKLWEDGTTEPSDSLLSAPTQNVSSTKTYITIMGDQDTGESETITLDYILDEKCE